MLERSILKLLKVQTLSASEIVEQLESKMRCREREIPEAFTQKVDNSLNELESATQIKRTSDLQYIITDIGRLRISMSEGKYISLLEANYVNRLLRSQNATDENLSLLTSSKIKCTTSGEKRQVLICPAELTRSSLEKDVKLGADKFASLLNATEADIHSRVTIIRAKREEDAYKAILYLFAMRENNDEIYPRQYADKNTFSLAEWSPEDSYENVLPIISVSHLDQKRHIFNTMSFGSMEGTGMRNHTISYWEGYSGDIVLINDSRYSIMDFSLSDAISCLSESRRIYVACIEGNNYTTDTFDFSEYSALDSENIDPDILKAIMRYDAASFLIPLNEDSSYMQLVLDGLCKKNKVTKKPEFTEADFINAVLEIEPQTPCDMMELVVKRVANRNKNRALDLSIMRTLKKIDSMPKISGWSRLEALYGMEEVKKDIKALVNTMKVNKVRKERGLPVSNTSCIAFLGPPGVAKSTVAEILADILFEEKLLPGKRFTAISGSGMQAPFVGQTSEKVRSLYYGTNVLLVDEMYSLTLNQDDGTYKGEVLSELCLLIEEAQQKGDHIIILAGYGGSSSSPETNLMGRALRSNTGIQSRVSKVIGFPSYAPADCKNIFFSIAKANNYHIDSAVTNDIENEIERYFSDRVNDPDFGNGREARTLFQCAISMAYDRICKDNNDINELPTETISTLTKEDILLAIESCKNMDASKRGKTTKSISLL